MQKIITEEIKQIAEDEARELLNSEQNGHYEPWGKFYTVQKDKEGDTLYVGYDNSTGNCWVEEFYTISGCMAWLRGEEVQDGD